MLIWDNRIFFSLDLIIVSSFSFLFFSLWFPMKWLVFLARKDSVIVHGLYIPSEPYI